MHGHKHFAEAVKAIAVGVVRFRIPNDYTL
jgi:hypothetical protein